jgi:hypothetical protein
MVEELADVSFLEAVELLVSLFEEAFDEENTISHDKVEEILLAFLKNLPEHFSEKLLAA